MRLERDGKPNRCGRRAVCWRRDKFASLCMCDGGVARVSALERKNKTVATQGPPLWRRCEKSFKPFGGPSIFFSPGMSIFYMQVMGLFKQKSIFVEVKSIFVKQKRFLSSNSDFYRAKIIFFSKEKRFLSS